MNNQGAEGSFGGQSVGSQSGSADANGSSTAGGANDGRDKAGERGGGMGGQPIGGNDSNTGSGTTLTAGYTPPRDNRSDAELGQGTTSNAGGSSVGTDQTSGGSSGVSGGEGFIGSKGGNSDEYLQEKSSPEDADFAKRGRGALDEDGDESGGGSR
jgi:hypothetical protein